ncbi:heme o synthase [Tundrisphaera lichenicola]|uniref:heme o synthase n=1 Tax=Tundrisphaera lichenicola TaxID=2029860 RepID=UPI003EB95574
MAVTLAPPVLVGTHPEPELITLDLRGRIAAYLALTKPRIAFMVLLTVAVGFVLGANGPIAPISLCLTLLGTGLVAGGASAWNMILERERDARMKRTANRSLPSGRVPLGGAVVFASVIGFIGFAMLGFGVNWLSAGVAATTFVLYVGLYTPMKALTTLNTAVGAIPGALPPVIGWAAATGRLGIEPWALFLIVFLWQFPHFLAIAWIYREDYARGGLKMLPNVDADGSMTGRQAVWHSIELLVAGYIPFGIGMAGPWYMVGALGLGLYYLYYAVRFWQDVNDRTARRLLRASFLYLPLVLLLLLLNPPA